MNRIFTSILSLSIGLLAYSQAPEVPNGDFENWEDFGNYIDPEDWKSLNSETVVFGQTLVTRTEEAHTGSYAVRLETRSLAITTAPAAMSLGYIVELDLLDRDMRGGLPSSEAPESFEGYYKFSPEGNDYGFIGCVLFKFDPSTGLQDTVARAIFKPTDEVQNYTHFKVDMEYLPGMEGVQHDTMNVIVSSSFKFGDPQAGTVLYVDDLKVNYEGTNSLTQHTADAISVYPNPLSKEGTIFVNLPQLDNQVEFNLVDITGKKIVLRIEHTTNGVALKPKKALRSGAYILCIRENETVINRKIIVQ